MLVTLAVGSILLALAVPAFRTFLQNDRLMTQASALSMALYAARSEAVKQDVSVQLCSSANGLTCSGAATWEQGWIVLSTAPGATPVQVAGAQPAGTTVRSTAGISQVTFLATGLANVGSGFKLCDGRGPTQARYVQLNITGNVIQSQRVGFDVNNNPLACP
ncbi:MAG: GspH/FimT family pseudopilin [Acetobacteraceae bacterium]|nr:GspH/FimT family pseudopilin [Acetobacteraceae bacterium]